MAVARGPWSQRGPGRAVEEIGAAAWWEKASECAAGIDVMWKEINCCYHSFDLSIWMELGGYLLRWGPKGKGQGQVHGGGGTVSPEPCLVQVKFQPPFRRPSGDLPGLQIGPSDSTHPKPNSSPSGLMPAAHQFHISVDGPTTCPRCPNRNSGHSNLYCAWYVCLSSIHSSPSSAYLMPS